MASEFTFTNPEAAKQAIARLQLQAALAENQSREAIAREQTNAQRAVTQSQLNDREKDRQVSREGIASQERWRSGYGSSATANDRANTQYQTVLGEIKASGSDPMTKRELEARIASFPEITKDLADNLRSERDIAYKAANDAYNMGDRLAKNYQTELDVFKKTPTAAGAADLYKRLNGDRNVAFDRSTGTVQSAFPKPREDASVTQSGILGSYKPGGVFPSAQEMQALGTPASTSTATGAAIPTIGDIRSRITGGIGNAAPVAPAPVVTASALSAPAPAALSGIGSWFMSPAAPREPLSGPMSYGGGVAIPGPRGVRISDFAPPQPTNSIAPSFSAPRPIQQMNLPQYQSPAGNIDALINMTRDPRFPTLPPEHQQFILDEIGNMAPRAFDLQQSPDYSPPPQFYQ